jgi:FkbM family methyltransferase
MNPNDRDGATETIDIENVMQEVRREILERRLPGQAYLPQSTAGLPPEYYEHLFRAGLAQSRLDVELLVTPSTVPLVGRLIDRLRVKVHELVVFYMNRFAANQAQVNDHLIQALSTLGRSEDEPAARSAAPGARYAPPAAGERATPNDVYACYHLLLGREPDEAGWEYWSSLVTDHDVTRAYVVDSFLNGHEFKAIQAARNNPILIELDDFKMYVRRNDNFIGAVIAREKRYEPHVSRVLKSMLPRRGTFVDVGANIGYFSLLAAACVGPQGRVIAFEPNPANCDLLRRSLAANGFGAVIDVHAAAVAEEKGRIHFSTAGVDSNGRIVNPAEAAAEVVALPLVEVVTLDEALSGCDHVDVIKIDVEGAEARVWRGMGEVVGRHRPLLLFEFSPGLLRLTSQVEPAEFLADVQSEYDLFIISPEGKTAGRPDSATTIIERQAASGLTHLDLLARPRRK